MALPTAKIISGILFLGCLYSASTVYAQSDCFDITINEKGGSIKPVTKLGLYLANQSCTYEIYDFLPAGLMFRFSKMDLEVDDTPKPCTSDLDTCTTQCDENDWVALLRLPSRTEVTRRCDQNVPTKVYRTEGAAAVYFHTDARIQRTGFVLDFEIDADTLPCTSTTSLQRASGVIQSYTRTIDGKYRANEDCRWLVQAPSGYNAIKITFTKMDLDGSCSGSSSTCNCDKDWVDIHDGTNDNAPIVTRRCGINLPSFVYTTGSSVYIRFATDATLQQTGFSLQYEATNIATTQFTGSTTIANPVIPWPMEEALEGYWPLDSKQGLKDSSKYLRHCSADCHGQLDSTKSGPFGYSETAYKTDGTDGILTVKNIRPAESQAVTVSFFIRVSAGDGGTVVALHDNNGNNAFQVHIVNSNGKTQFRIANASVAYGYYDGLQPDVWSFLSVVINNNPCSLTIYGQNGQLYAPQQSNSFCEHLDAMQSLSVGKATGDPSALSSSSSVACLNVYSAALSWSDLQRVRESCRAAQGAVSCGAPRIPTSPVPLATSTSPIHGQFPWAASLHASSDSSYLCSAAIIDQRYLLTSARCFKTYSDPLLFTVHVSNHDLSLTDNHEKIYAVDKIILHPNYSPESKSLNGDIALVRLATAIDLSNDYVNAICLPEDADSYEVLPTTETYYFFGWGANGRSQLISQTVPRYVAGKVLTTEACQEVYPYDAICFQANTASVNNVPCTGDEGGLLLKVASTALSSDSRLVPVGTYSRRTGNDCDNGFPALFNEISPYLSWINKQLVCDDCASCTACSA